MPLSPGPSSTRPAAGSEPIWDHGPTSTRIADFEPPPEPPDPTVTPSLSSALLPAPPPPPPPSHPTTTTGACPSQPVVNGAGQEPTTAGEPSLADQSWVSHQTLSPPSSAPSAAPVGEITPLTQKNQSYG